jgi:hypothetical protein
MFAMDRIVMKSRVGSDGVLTLRVPVSDAAADTDVQVTIEPVYDSLPVATAADLLQSGLIGLWADRTDIGDSRDYARELRERAQTTIQPY